MNSSTSVAISLYSIAVIIFIIYEIDRQRLKQSISQKLFKHILLVTVFMFVMDFVSRCDHSTGLAYGFAYAANLVLFLLCPVVPILWFMYVHYQIFRKWTKAKRWVRPLILTYSIYVIVIAITAFNGMLLYYDANHVFHRGYLFWIPFTILYLFVFITCVMVLVFRGRIEKRFYLSLLFFAVPPMFLGIMQFVFYGLPFTLCGLAFSELIVYVNIQNSSTQVDYLTGAFNRQKLDQYIQDKISTSSRNRTFSAMLIDLDDFKYINDTFGHSMGDHALVAVVGVLRRSFAPDDLLARFGGDEFCVVMGESDEKKIKAAIKKFYDKLRKFNETTCEQFVLDCSIGYAVYDPQSHMNVEAFQEKIDALMYENKRAKKQINNKNNQPPKK